ncbi:MAG: hypothetical protein JNM39_03585 [Bdellovibrionaceae bacterium]|nr:hypothetical protein [Pseudobdellovibrionaceae bacterium]
MTTKKVFTSVPLRLFCISSLGCLFLGCSLFDRRPNSAISSFVAGGANQRVLFAPYDQVWRAAHTVIKYPIAGENQDTGLLETETIKFLDGWLPPEIPKQPSHGMRYKLFLTFAKGRIEGRESTRLTIEKKIEKQKDFFSEPDQIESDGLEEKVIFYRIERELIINETLRRAAQTQ